MNPKKCLLVLALLPALACSARQIPGTSVEDTPENRVIVDIINNYRIAVENKDMNGILELVSRDYFSNYGTTADAEDDYGYEQLVRNILPVLRDDVKSVHYVIYVRRVTFPRDNICYADIEFSYKFFYVEQGKDRWKVGTNLDRMEFMKEDGVWRITSGL